MEWTHSSSRGSDDQRAVGKSTAGTWDQLTDDLAAMWVKFAERVGPVRSASGGRRNTVTMSVFVENGTVDAELGDDDAPFLYATIVGIRSSLITAEYEQLPDPDDDGDGFNDGYEAILDRIETGLVAAAGRPDAVGALSRADPAGRLRYLVRDTHDPQRESDLRLPHQQARP